MEPTPAEILRGVIESGRSIERFRVAETESRESGRDRFERKEESVVVGGDRYSAHESAIPTLRVPPLRSETLWCKGEMYERDSPKRPWRLVPSERTMLQPEMTGDISEERLRLGRYLDEAPDRMDFETATGVERLDDQALGEQTLFHLVARYDKTLDMPDLETVRQHLEATGEDAALLEAFTHLPDRMAGTIELWVGADDFRIYRSTDKGAYYRGDDETESYERIREYSDHNGDVELPGPLPEP